MKLANIVMNDPAPVRRMLKAALRKASFLPFRLRYAIGALQRMHYAYIVYQAAHLAYRLGHERVSVLEFGVAGGNGLVWLERHAEEVEKLFPVKIEIYGFDTGRGLPPPSDYRDLPYHWQAGFFRMDEPALRKKLKRSTLVLGDVADTTSTFHEKYSPAPIGAVSQDLDFYSSTVHALRIFDLPGTYLLPRIFCYFDDTVGSDVELYSDYTGERLAIHEFNDTHTERKIGIPYHLRSGGIDRWQHQIWVTHMFDHPDYNRFVSSDDQQLRLNA
jgi:hypothetical protein